MNGISLRDAKIIFHNNRLGVETGKVKAVFDIGDNIYVKSFVNLESGYEWAAEDSTPCLRFIDGNQLDFDRAEFEDCDNDGLSEKFITVKLYFKGSTGDIIYKISVTPGSAFVQTEMYIKAAEKPCAPETEQAAHPYLKESAFSMAVKKAHYRYKVFEFFDFSDKNNTLVESKTDYTYTCWQRFEEGHYLIMSDCISGEELMLVREAPTSFSYVGTRHGDDFVIDENHRVFAGNVGIQDKLSSDYERCYGITVGCASPENKPFESSLREYKALYRKVNLGDKTGDLCIMSNTWGDKKDGTNFSNEFIINEIKAAGELGVDCMQIDAEWQNTSSRMWEVDERKFPQKLAPITKACHDCGVKLGLWFVPLMDNEYEGWSTDADILINYCRNDDATYFKVDGTTLSTKDCETRFFNFFKKINKETDGKAVLNYDITASMRGGYLQEKQYGTLFVENRYTDWHNYYPHYTLRNAWTLAEVMPLRRVQLEFLNVRRNKELYKDDVLAPDTYRMDYLYATTAFSNPLVWCEMQYLEKQDFDLLKKVISVFKPYGKRIFNADVCPIGSCPDGTSLTGFDAKTDDKSGLVLLFREHTNKKECMFDVDGIKDIKVIYESAPCTLKCVDGKLNAVFDEEASFVFAEYTK
ncbi:MAG: alpha-galactosidase [Firmicutes bacterium]|nr:alpha-galactosidase [Bacillota bacterium]